jgi:hypothetical protein
VTVNVTSLNAVRYLRVCVAVARVTQLPAAEKVRTAVVESIEHDVVPADVTEYVMVAESNPVASAEGVRGEAVFKCAVVGAQVTT